MRLSNAHRFSKRPWTEHLDIIHRRKTEAPELSISRKRGLAQGLAPEEGQPRSQFLRIRFASFALHMAAVKHVEHICIGRAASITVIAHEIVDAHPRSIRRLRSGWWGCAIVPRRKRLQGAVSLRRRVVSSTTRGGGRLGIWRRGGATGFVRICAGRRWTARWMGRIVRLLAMLWWWSARVGRRRGRWRYSVRWFNEGMI